MSLKLSALALYDADPNKDSSTLVRPRKQEVKAMLLELLQEAKLNGVFLRIDMEYFIHKDVTFEIFAEILDEHPEYADSLGMVIQAFLKDSPQDAEEMAAWAKAFYERTGKRVSLRLVKGANITPDREQAEAGLHHLLKNEGWHGKKRRAMEIEGPDHWQPGITPTAKDNATTQRQFLEITKLFEQNSRYLDVAYGTHNQDTQAHIIQTWLNNGQPPSERQMQSLLGMYPARRWALKNLGVRQRAYVPYGLLGKILAYMTRRFKELKDAEGGRKMSQMTWGQNGTNKIRPHHVGEEVRVENLKDPDRVAA